MSTTPRTALITGASSGIGRELAALFAADGWDLVLVGRDEARLAEVAGEARRLHGIAAIPLARDLSEPGACDALVRELAARGLRVDALVNNAGFNVYGPFTHTDGAAEARMIDVNVTALTRLTKLLLPAMVANGSGYVLNVGSTGSFSPGPHDAVYCATKAYVLSFTEAVAEEVAGTGVGVTALCPGPTRTRFAERAGMGDVRLFRLGTMSAADVALAGYRALMRGRRVVVPGTVNRLMALSVRFTPRRLVAWSGKFLLGRGEASWKLSSEARD